MVLNVPVRRYCNKVINIFALKKLNNSIRIIVLPSKRFIHCLPINVADHTNNFLHINMKSNKGNLHQTLSIIPVGYAEFAMGFGFGWLAPTLKRLQDPASELPLNIEESSWIGSLHELGRFFGPLITAFLLDKVGRKPLLVFCALIFFLKWLVVLYTRSALVICIVRFIFGITIGMCDSMSSIYIGENCSVKIRGILCGITVVCFYAGILLQFIIATYLPYDVIAMINLANGFLGLLSTYFMQETPQFLLLKGKSEEAMKGLMWLNGTKNVDDIREEFDIISRNVVEEKKKKLSYRELLMSPANYKSVLIMIFLNLLAMCTGMAAMIAFVSIVFASSDTFNSYEYTVLSGTLTLISVCLSTCVIERVNRRTFALLGFSVCALAHSFTALLFFMQEKLFPVKYFPWLIFGTISLYTCVYSGLDAIVHMIRGELFPQSIKPIGGGLSVMAHSSMGFATTRVFLPIAESFGMYVNFMMFSAVALGGFLLTYFVLPETRGKTLVEIQKSLEK